MKKLILIGALLFTLAAAIPIVGAGDTATITITMNNNALANITVTPTTWISGVGIGESNTTTGDYFTLENVGFVTVDVEIKGEDSGSGWTIENTAGHNAFKVEYNVTAWTTITDGYLTFASDLAPVGSDTIGFDLKLTMPTSTSTAAAQSTVITLKATPNA